MASGCFRRFFAFVWPVGLMLAAALSVQQQSIAAVEHLPPPQDLFPVRPDTNPALKIASNLAALPEAKIDLASAELKLEKEYWPGLDVKKYVRLVDRMAVALKLFSKGTIDPDKRIRYMNEFFYKQLGLDYYRDAGLIMSGDYKVSSLYGLLDSRKGTCFSLPLLYAAIAQRLGWPIHLVAAPRHFFLRYEDPKLAMKNIEATSYGGYSSDEVYIKDFKISDLALKQGTYMRSLSNREVLGAMIDRHSGHWINDNLKSKDNVRWMVEVSRSIQLNNLSAKLYPESESVYINQGDNYNRLAVTAHKIYKTEWTNFPKERINANVLELMNQDMSAIRAYGNYAQGWYSIARANGVREADFTPDWEKDFRDDIEKGRSKADALQKQFAEERKAALEKLKKQTVTGELRLL